ncbi:MAG: DNA primase [Firmicutes bacterium]|nr:DNA primase [Bacillota bacterium]
MRASEIFARARDADLPSMWQGTLHKGNGRYTSNWTPCCGEGSRRDRGSIGKVGGIWRWRCFVCNSGGTAVDYVAMCEGMSPDDAARKIVSGSVNFSQIVKPIEKNERPVKATGEAMAAVINMLKKHPLTEDVVAYLEGRGLTRRTIVEAKKRGILACLPSIPEEAVLWLEVNVGREAMSEAGMWSKRWPSAAYRPLILINGSGLTLELRQLTESIGSSPKAIQYGIQDAPFVWKPRGEVNRIVVVEGGIDLLSMVDIGDVDDALIIGIFGTGTWRAAWGKKISEKYPSARWEIATDANDAGHKCAESVSVQLDGLGKKWSRRIPFCGEDWNDALKSISA